MKVKSIMVAASAGFSLWLNGEPVPVRDTPPQTTLLDFIRSRGLTGAKEGCAEGECGACAVLIASRTPGSPEWQAVNSCLIPLPAAAGREVVTVEGLATQDRITAAQTAMIEHGGSQCGYCTPGFVIGMIAAQCAADRDVAALAGNLCRCTGYRPIGEAFAALPSEAPSLPKHPNRPERGALCYSHADGKFSRPATLAACFAVMRSDPEARVVAGNTDLGIETNLRDHRFPHLISLEALEELRQFKDGADCVEIGAALSLTEIANVWQDAPPVFREWLSLFASPLIRNRATLGGNLATASPIGDSAPLLLSLDAEVTIESAAGARIVPLDKFFVSYRQTALAPGEVLRSIRIPKPFPSEARFYKVAKRRMDDISTVAAGIALTRDAVGTILRARIAYGGVAATPVRVRELESAIVGTRDAAPGKDLLPRILKPIGDHRGSAEYRLAMAWNLVEKALCT